MKANFGNWSVSNDEWYTTEYTAEYVVNKYIKWLEGKKIILPCDSEWSELYKACKRHNLDCEISRDMYNVDYSKLNLLVYIINIFLYIWNAPNFLFYNIFFI